MASQWALWLMANHPERLLGSVFIGAALDLAPGYQDREYPFDEPYTSTEATGGSLVVLNGAGHIPMARDPVKVNLLIREFVESLEGMAR